jgi:Synaphin protein
MFSPFWQQEAIKKAEEERRIKHKKMEEEREHLRQNIRDKVSRFAAQEKKFFLSETLCLPSLIILGTP